MVPVNHFKKNQTMKKIILFSIISFVFIFSGSLFAQKSKSEDIKVWGNCGMCKKTIEAAAINGGAKDATWNDQTKILSISYNSKKTDSKKIQEAVAASGYDTQDLTAPTEVYNKLHSCCQYDRKVSEKSNLTSTMSCCENEKCSSNKDCCSDGKCEKDHTCCK
jgi:hypothetical protein